MTIIIGSKKIIVAISDIIQSYDTIIHHRDNSRIGVNLEQMSLIPESMLDNCTMFEETIQCEEIET